MENKPQKEQGERTMTSQDVVREFGRIEHGNRPDEDVSLESLLLIEKAKENEGIKEVKQEIDQISGQRERSEYLSVVPTYSPTELKSMKRIKETKNMETEDNVGIGVLGWLMDRLPKKWSARIMSGIAGLGIMAAPLAAFGEESVKTEISGEVLSKEGTPSPLIETPEVKPSPTPDYAIKEREINEIKADLLAKGCDQKRLLGCARTVYAIQKSGGFVDTRIYVNQENTVLSKWVTVKQVYEFGRTGEGLEAIYLKDEKGKKTDNLAFFYIADPEYKFDIEYVQMAIDWWEEDAPGFLQAMVDNEVCVLLQAKASERGNGNAKYGVGIIYYDYGLDDAVGFETGLIGHFPVEMFGVKGDALKGRFGPGAVAVIKQEFARISCEYLAKKKNRNKKKNYIGIAEDYKLGVDAYLPICGYTLEEINVLIDEIKDEGYMAPWAASNWAEIYSVVNATANESNIVIAAKK
jgi:hypothetical protein